MGSEHFFMLIPLFGIFAVFIALPWMILHYIARFRETRGLSQADERMLEDLWRTAREISRRMETVERILEIAPENERSPK
jgi:phage shock protein B